MKYYILAAALISSPVFAEIECDENGNPISDITALATPNCLNEKYLGPAIENNPTQLCNTCKTNFQKFVDAPIPSLGKTEKQNKFLEAALKEYQKNLTENLLETLKLRALRPTGASFSKSIDSCKMKSLDDFSKDCKSPYALQFLKNSELFNKFNEAIPQELGKILATDGSYKPKDSLLKRNTPACFIPEKDLLYISISALEETLSPEIIKIFSTLDPSKFGSIEEMLVDESVLASNANLEELSIIFSSFRTHPLISDKFNSPSSMINFFKSIKEPKDVLKLRESIYNTTNGNEFDSKLAQKCDEGFKSLKEAICSPDFEAGRITLNAFQNHNKLFSSLIKPSPEEFTTTPELERKNIDILKLCDVGTENAKVQLSSVLSKLNKSLNTNYVDSSLESYKSEKHEKDLGKNNEKLCQRKNEDCNENTYECKLLQKYKSYLNPDSVDFKLANSSNKEVNELLRSMIGDTSKIDSKTKEILIAQGIIPRDDGTMVAQADIPERRPDFVQREQAQAKAATSVGQAKQAAASTTNRPGTNRTPASSESFDQGYSNNNTPESQIALPDFSDLMGDQQELRSIQDEIKRRLLGLPEHKPASKADAQRIVRDSFRSRNQALSPQMEDAFANRLMQQAPSPSTQGFNNANNPENRAQVSGGETANEKWRKSQDQAALMGMAGAQSVLGKDSSNGAGSAAGTESKPKDLTKVALNISEDPQVRLSDIFNKKIDQNDTETQLLRVLLKKKNNFLLQIKSMNFKVVFDQNNNFNVLLESGDRAEADRIRPQLEMFLKKLKS